MTVRAVRQRTQYVEGPIRVHPPDPFDLGRDGDSWGCQDGYQQLICRGQPARPSPFDLGRIFTACSRDLPTQAGTDRDGCPLGLPALRHETWSEALQSAVR
jgi:hypothetical protein